MEIPGIFQGCETYQDNQVSFKGDIDITWGEIIQHDRKFMIQVSIDDGPWMHTEFHENVKPEKTVRARFML